MSKIETTGQVEKQGWRQIIGRLQSQRAYQWALRALIVMCVIAFISPFLANDKPLWCVYKGAHHFPLLKSWAVDAGISEWPPELLKKDWTKLKLDKAVWPLVPYAPNTTDIYNGNFASPFGEQTVESIQFRHWLGTDQLGKDVLAGLLWGTRTALLVGLIAMFIASFIGILLGAIAGYFGDHDLNISRIGFLGGLLGLLASCFYVFFTPLMSTLSLGSFTLVLISLCFIMLNTYAVYWLFTKTVQANWAQKQLTIPADSIIMRMIEVLNSIPGLLLLLTIAGLLSSTSPSLFMIMAIIGLLSWTTIARFVRGELLRIRQLEYIDAARTLGFSQWHILRKHALPNALGPVLVTISFGIASAVILEAALSFLGISGTAGQITWGTLLNSARHSPEAWWLAVFPGLAIFVTVFVFNYLGEGLSKFR